MKKLFSALAAALLILQAAPLCFADEALGLDIHVSQYDQVFTDGVSSTKVRVSPGGALTVSSDREIASLYLVFDSPAPAGVTIASAGGSQLSASGFIHDFIELEHPASELTLTFSGSTALCDIYAFSQGEPPAWVQRWRPNGAPCDVLFLPTHIEDEMLCFGAALALASDREGCEVQLAYMVDHQQESSRPHQLLDGLWELGITRYPIVSAFPDAYTFSLEDAKTVYDQNELLQYTLDIIKRLKPQIVFAHDINGENGDGAQMLNSLTSIAAVEQASAGPGGWQVKKLYLHLYDKNKITLSCNSPLWSFGGATAYEMAARGFSHNSQSQFFSVERDGPNSIRDFGLYHSTVGPDTWNDFFENITLYRDSPPGQTPEPAPETEPEAQAEAEAQPPAGELPAPGGEAAKDALQTALEFVPESVSADAADAAAPGGSLRQPLLPEAAGDLIFAVIGSPVCWAVMLFIPPVAFFLLLVKNTSEEDF